jgi:hypothetical protein
MSIKHPIILKAILIINFPFFILVIVVMFIIALVCSFCVGIYMTVMDIF